MRSSEEFYKIGRRVSNKQLRVDRERAAKAKAEAEKAKAAKKAAKKGG